MKSFITPTYTFTPGASGVGSVDLSGIANFNIKRLVAIINQTTGTLIYSTGSTFLRYTNVAGTTVTLFYDTTAMNAADVLQVIYEDVSQESQVVANNSSTTPLTGGASFVGTAMDIEKFACINVNVISDQASATNGLKVEYSPDGINWDHSHSTTYSGAGVGRGTIFNAEYRYARVVYTNGATPQTYFRIQTILKSTFIEHSAYTLDQTINGSTFASVVRANLTAKNPIGNYVSIDCTNGGNLKFSLEEFNGSTIGQKTMAQSLAVVIASDQSTINTNQIALTPSFQESSVIGSGGATTFVAPANAKWCKVYAEEGNTANLRVKIGGTATTTSGFQFQPGRSEDFNAAGNVSVIAESGSNQKVCIQFGA